MEQKIKFKWWNDKTMDNEEFIVNSSYVPPIGATVSIPHKIGEVKAIHCIHSRFDGWDMIVIELSATL